jgi:hypothetical protein
MAKQMPAANQPSLFPESSRTVQMPPLSLRADLGPQSIDDASRTVELIWTTGAAVQRMDYWTGEKYVEVLSLDPAHVRLDRLNEGAPLLDSHSAYSVADQLGAVVPGSATLFKKAATVKVRFSKRDAVEPIWQDVKDGLIRSVSVGYRVHRFEETTGKDNKVPVRTAIDWEPFEVSMVPIPADPGAKTRGEAPADSNECEIVTRGAETIAPPEPVKSEPPAKETQPANPGAQKEQKMIENARSETIVEHDPAPARSTAPAPTEPNERDAGGLQERVRVQGIRNACLAARLPRSFEDKLIADGIALVDAQSRVFDELRKRADPTPGVPDPNAGRGVEIVGDDPLVHKRAGIEKALLHRLAPEFFKLDAEAQAYRGMSLLEMGDVFLRAKGVRVTGMSRSERAIAALTMRDGMHTIADFPLLLADAANKVLRAAYDAAPQTWLPISKQVSLTDFKTSKQLQLGDAPGLIEVLEHGEFTSGTITEARELVQLRTYGRIFSITRQALINDDTNAFADVPAAFGRQARNLESDLAWAQITSNPAMGDGVALFAAAHRNLSPFGQNISIGHLSDGRTAMRTQLGLDGVTYLNLTPSYLIVPAALETTALALVLPGIQTATGVNPFTGTLTVIAEPRLDAASPIAWYLACPAAQAPVLFHAVLDGQTGPQVEQQIGFDIDGLKIKCRLDVGFKAADWRSIYRDPGV